MHGRTPASVRQFAFLFSYPEPGARGRRQAPRFFAAATPEAKPSRRSFFLTSQAKQALLNEGRPRVLAATARSLIANFYFRKSKTRSVTALSTSVYWCRIRAGDSL